jgi:CSLREA domain-containing protein
MFRKSLLAIMVFAAMPLIAATDKTIYVTTLSDEDGENTSACSLREALKAASTNRAYGGCIAGQVSGTDKIVLKNIKKGEGNTYTLKGTLNIDSNVSITGEDAFSYDKPDTVNNTYPGRTELKTIIEGDGTFPLFNSTISRSSFSLTSIILRKGHSTTHGGAIRAGGTVTLNRVHILDSSAVGSGGAIYLEGQASALSITDGLIQGNTASRGAVLGMSCIDNVDWTKRSIAFERTAIVKNGINKDGTSTAQNIIEFCGTPTATITASTIGENRTSNNDQSAIIKYTHDQDTNSQIYVLHPASSLALNSNTIVKNESRSTLLYDNVGRLTLTYMYNLIFTIFKLPSRSHITLLRIDFSATLITCDTSNHHLF